jgi:hypothetical protein
MRERLLVGEEGGKEVSAVEVRRRRLRPEVVEEGAGWTASLDGGSFIRDCACSGCTSGRRTEWGKVVRAAVKAVRTGRHACLEGLQRSEHRVRSCRGGAHGVEWSTRQKEMKGR